MSYKYFNLYPECYLVLGEKNSVIHNLLTKEMILLNDKNTEWLKRSERNEVIDDDEEVFVELRNLKWGFLSEKKFFVDKLRTINVFNQKKFWKDTPVITSAVIQITNKCNLNCDFCKEAFCPVCTKLNDEPKEKLHMSVEKWMNIIDELKNFDVKNILFTGGEVALYEGISSLVKYAIKNNFNVALNTNALIKIKDLPKDIQLNICLFDRKNLDEIILNYNEYDNVTIMPIDIENKGLISNFKNNNWIIKNSSYIETTITDSKVTNTDLNRFFVKKLGDSCLKGKITICYDGTVIPCLGSKNKPIGNIEIDGISKIVKSLVVNYWDISIDENSNGKIKCNKCELRYACISCCCSDVENKCKYYEV